MDSTAQHIEKIEEEINKLKEQRHEELNLRDRFAMAALSSIIADHVSYAFESTAEKAYKMADAMLKQRELREE